MIDLGGKIVPSHRHAQQELDARHDAVAIADGEPFFFDQRQLEPAHVVGCRRLRRAFEESGEPLATVDMAAQRMTPEFARTDVVDHALTQRTDDGPGHQRTPE